MSDLVDRVCNAMAYKGTKSCLEAGHPVVYPNSLQQQAMARAAITAVLDDLMEPTQLMLNEARSVGCHTSVPMPMGDMEIREEIRAAVRAKHDELGLGSPVEPQDAPNAPDPTRQPKTS